MNFITILSLTASAFSIALAIFAIWLSFQQRKESQNNYENTKSVLSEVEKAMAKTEMLVSDNFQNLLKSMTEQQNKMLESLKPRPTTEEKYAEMFANLAQDDPDKLNAVADAIARFQQPPGQI